MHPLGFARLSAASPLVTVADPRANARAISELRRNLMDSDIVVFPELAISGYTCGDLFHQSALLETSLAALQELVVESDKDHQLWFVGVPFRLQGRLYNTAAAIHHGRLLGLIPKQYLPTYSEFYEARWFTPGDSHTPSMAWVEGFGQVPFGTDLLFECGEVTVGVEICEDLWMPVPPSSLQSLHGANVLLNLSASNETIGKANYRRDLVSSQSGRCVAAYAYASSGPSESTTDLVFGGHCLVAETGYILSESRRVGEGWNDANAKRFASADIDLGRIAHDRQATGTFMQGAERLAGPSFRKIPFSLTREPRHLKRVMSGQPFIPKATDELEARCREIFEIQTAGLAKRVEQLSPKSNLVIGVSGGLDSTLALLVAVAACDAHGWDRRRILGITMPGYGTSNRTLENAERLMRELEITASKIDIREVSLRVFQDLEHRPFSAPSDQNDKPRDARATVTNAAAVFQAASASGIAVEGLSVEQFQAALESLPDELPSDLVFENVQARLRTLLLMSRGFVLGTGDLSEQALGWSTYNGDHMSMYNVNCSIPKTLVRFLVRYVAEHRFEGAIRETLLSIVGTPISPELLPLSKKGEIQQSTESSIGPYELHDFFLYYFLRTGASPKKLLLLAEHAEFSRPYELAEIRKTLRTFLTRFFANQFKRSCVPDGPKVGSVSLSPRGDWRMPSDASVQAWLRDV